jgi:hypothetical protein
MARELMTPARCTERETGASFVKGSMSSDAVVIMSVRFQNPAEMRLTQNDDVIQTLTPDRSDQPFGKAILPRWVRLVLWACPGCPWQSGGA